MQLFVCPGVGSDSAYECAWFKPCALEDGRGGTRRRDHQVAVPHSLFGAVDGYRIHGQNRLQTQSKCFRLAIVSSSIVISRERPQLRN